MRPSRRSSVAPFIVMEVLRAANVRAAAGESILRLEAGEPSGPVPGPVRAAVHAALDGAHIGYTDTLGLPALRARIAQLYRERHGLDVPAARVVVTAGASGAFLLAFLAAFDVGGRVGLAEPGYPAYRNILKLLGLEPVTLASGPETRFQPTPESLTNAAPLDGLIVQSPANPTGAMLTPGALEALVKACAAQGIALISDEIYHGIAFEEPAETALAFSDDVMVVNSFSKYFCMTGFRIGWLVVPDNLLRSVERLAQNLFIAPNALSQYAALGAFEAKDELEARVKRYDANRRILMDALPPLGLSVLAPPQGAFYLYVDVRTRTNDSEAFAAEMLAKTGVAATPGTDFDPENGKAALRFSFAGSTEDIEEAAKRLTAWLK